LQRSRSPVLACLLAGLAALLATFATACDGDDAPDAITWTQLRNATYPSMVAPGEQFAMVDGSVQVPVEGGTSPLARLADIAAYGEIDDGNSIDTAVFLTERSPSGGWVTSLVAVLNRAGQPAVQTPVLLGENVVVVGATISDGGQITARVRAQNSVDSSAGTIEEITTVSALEDGALVIREESTERVATVNPETFVHEATALELPASGRDTLEFALEPRHAASYVFPGTAGQQLELTATSDFDSAIISVQGLSDDLSVVSLRTYSNTFAGELPATQDYIVRVLSVAGEELDVELEYAVTPHDAEAAAEASPITAPTNLTELAAAVPLGEVDELARDRPLDALSPQAMEYIGTRAPARGIAVITADGGLVYAENADEELETASVIKVVVMTCTMRRAEQEGRLVSEWELTMMWPMITWSDNDATDALWYDLGGGPAIAACLDDLGADGITPYMGDYWGTSTASARGIATLMGRIAFGEAVNETHRAVALAMLTSVVPDQRWGVPAGADGSGNEIVGVKDGWYPDDAGWRVNSVGFISPLSADQEPYAIAVMTNYQTSMEYGIETIEGLALPVYEALRGE
jgi:hypothetical protein